MQLSKTKFLLWFPPHIRFNVFKEILIPNFPKQPSCANPNSCFNSNMAPCWSRWTDGSLWVTIMTPAQSWILLHTFVVKLQLKKRWDVSSSFSPQRVQSKSPSIGMIRLFLSSIFVGIICFTIFQTMAWTLLGTLLPHKVLKAFFWFSSSFHLSLSQIKYFILYHHKLLHCVHDYVLVSCKVHMYIFCVYFNKLIVMQMMLIGVE